MVKGKAAREKGKLTKKLILASTKNFGKYMVYLALKVGIYG